MLCSMKASPRQQRLLLDLQDLDTATARLKRKRAGIPERSELAALSGEAESAKASFMEAQRELDGHGAELARIEADVEMVRQRRTRDEQLLAVSTSPKEAQALQSELDTLTRRTGELEDRELEIMEAQEAAQAGFDAAEAVLSGVESKRTALREQIAAAEAEIDAQLARQADERGGLSAEIQRDLVEIYEDLRGRIGIGAARLRGNVSEASNMSLTPAELSTIRATADDELIFCPGTGAILVRVEGE